MNPIKNKTVLVGKPSSESEKASFFSFGDKMQKFKEFFRKLSWLVVSVCVTGYIVLETHAPGYTNEQMVKFIAPAWSREEIEAEIEAVTKEHGIPKELLAAIVEAESAYQTDAMRYEPVVYERLKNVPQNSRQALASSHGLAQVMGYHAQQTCGLKSWIELTDPSKNLACAVIILNRNLKDSKGDVFTAVRMYNGSGAKAEAYANKVLAKFTNLIVKEAQVAAIERKNSTARKGAVVDTAKIQKALNG